MIFRPVFFGVLLLAAASGAEPTNGIQPPAPAPVTASGTNDPAEVEFRKLMEADDAALAAVDLWVRDNQMFAEKGAGVPADDLNRRILRRVEPVRLAYDDFLKRHPGHIRARLAYAGLLEEIGEAKGALEQMLKARDLEPGNPVVWNNLGNHHGLHGSPTNAFAHFEKAIQLDPKTAVYPRNLASAMMLFRKEAAVYHGITEDQVAGRAITLYSKALALDPDNFLLASDLAMAWYAVKPARTPEALKAWEAALKLSEGRLQREGVLIHLARLRMEAGDLSRARAHLGEITQDKLGDLKTNLLQEIDAKEKAAGESATNPPAVRSNPAASLQPRP